MLHCLEQHRYLPLTHLFWLMRSGGELCARRRVCEGRLQFPHHTHRQPHGGQAGKISVHQDGLLLPGDVVLVSTPGAALDLYREATGTVFDHVGMVVAPGVVLHVGPPRIRLLPTSTVLRGRKAVAVLRPTSHDVDASQHAARVSAMTSSVVGLVGEKYAGMRAVGLVARLITQHAVGHPGLPPLPSVAPGGAAELTAPAPRRVLGLGRWLCSDVVLAALGTHFPPFRRAWQAHARDLRMREVGVSVPDDLWTLHKACPGLFHDVPLPPRPPPPPPTTTRQRLDKLLHKCVRLAQIPGGGLAAGVRTLPQALLRSASLLLYTGSLLAVARGWLAPHLVSAPPAAMLGAAVRAVRVGVALVVLGWLATRVEEVAWAEGKL